ncbi:MAG: septum formation initiator family protein, partial [Actinomycetaceae bacterium]|nr:septum formation initiator family protein [Actinomycetaceae bacterium]
AGPARAARSARPTGQSGAERGQGGRRAAGSGASEKAPRDNYANRHTAASSRGSRQDSTSGGRGASASTPKRPQGSNEGHEHEQAREPSRFGRRAGKSASRPADSRTSGRRNETRRPTTARFATRRSVVVEGSKGPKQISLRLLTILLFAALAVIIVTPTLANYIEKQQELRELRSELTTVEEHNEELEREIELWKDDDYVRSQARQRLGYVMPGQQLYVVTDSAEGTAQEQLEKKVASLNRDRRAATPWYSTMWDSLKVAGQTDLSDNPDDTPLIKDEPNG